LKIIADIARRPSEFHSRRLSSSAINANRARRSYHVLQ